MAETEQADREPLSLGQVTVPKASDILAGELRERILNGTYPEGTSLPAERELVSQTGLSRTTVREALRILEVQDLVRIRSGRSGGAFVQRPGEQAMARTMDHIIKGRRITLDALLAAREAIEPFAAQLAAKNRSEPQLLAIEKANARLAEAADDPAAGREAGVQWHIEVARASNNSLLAGLIAALSRAIDDAPGSVGMSDADELSIAAHEGATEAIRAQDESAAYRQMAAHIGAVDEDSLGPDHAVAPEQPRG